MSDVLTKEQRIHITVHGRVLKHSMMLHGCSDETISLGVLAFIAGIRAVHALMSDEEADALLEAIDPGQPPPPVVNPLMKRVERMLAFIAMYCNDAGRIDSRDEANQLRIDLGFMKDHPQEPGTRTSATGKQQM